MTVKRDLKSIIRERQRKTGESYTTARTHVMRDRAKLLGVRDAPKSPERIRAAVLAVFRGSAILRELGAAAPMTLHANGLSRLVPGQLADLALDLRWSVAGESHAHGRIASVQLDVAALGLEPLTVRGDEIEDLRASHEPYRAPDPYAALWEQLTARPRAVFEMDRIAWGALPGQLPDQNPIIDAVELKERGEQDAARDLLMNTLARDLRCIDAHGHLGHLVFRRSPMRAIIHYDIGLRIGELSLPPGFDGVFPWTMIYNRPFLRCLHGYGLCLWRLERFDEAQQVFERLLALNPNDNQGARFCWQDVAQRVTWREAQRRDARGQRSLARDAAGKKRTGVVDQRLN